MELNSFRNLGNDRLVKDKSGNNPNKKDDFEVEKINTIFTTKKEEESRKDFDETFEENNINDKKSEQGKKFHEGLTKNKSSLMKDLGLSDDEYDSLACIAMALASQETGMGLEKGYKAENTDGNIEKILRDKAIEAGDKIRSSQPSASSGLTQIKIHDYMKNPEIKETLKKYGIVSENKVNNNLYSEPDKAAVATMVILADIAKNSYSKYENALEEAHQKIRTTLDPNLTDEQCLKKGENALKMLEEVYNYSPYLSGEESRKGIGQILTNWLLSVDDSVPDEKFCNSKIYKEYGVLYCESVNLKILNSVIGTYGYELKQEDLNYIRYALSTDKYKLNPVECLAYTWHYGEDAAFDTDKKDRMLAEKTSVMFTETGKSCDQRYTGTVEELTDLYGQQAGTDIDEINDLIDNYINNN